MVIKRITAVVDETYTWTWLLSTKDAKREGMVSVLATGEQMLYSERNQLTYRPAFSPRGRLRVCRVLKDFKDKYEKQSGRGAEVL